MVAADVWLRFACFNLFVSNIVVWLGAVGMAVIIVACGGPNGCCVSVIVLVAVLLPCRCQSQLVSARCLVAVMLVALLLPGGCCQCCCCGFEVAYVLIYV
jgi:hypothetical protein